jgi:hypothetical protein
MDIEKFARSISLRRASSVGQTDPSAAEEIINNPSSIVPRLDITKGEEIHKAPEIETPVLYEPGQIVVTWVEAPEADVATAVNTMELFDRAKVDSSAMVMKGLLHDIHKNTFKKEVGRFTPESIDPDQMKALMPEGMMGMPTKEYAWGKNAQGQGYIVISKDVTYRQDQEEHEDDSHLEDSSLPATLSKNSPEVHGKHIVIIKAAPGVIQDNPALNPAIQSAPAAELPQAQNSASDMNSEAPVETLGGDKGRFIPKAANFTWAPDATQTVVTATPEDMENNPALNPAPTEQGSQQPQTSNFGAFLNGAPAPAGTIKIGSGN